MIILNEDVENFVYLYTYFRDVEYKSKKRAHKMQTKYPIIDINYFNLC